MIVTSTTASTQQDESKVLLSERERERFKRKLNWNKCLDVTLNLALHYF